MRTKHPGSGTEWGVRHVHGITVDNTGDMAGGGMCASRALCEDMYAWTAKSKECSVMCMGPAETMQGAGDGKA